MSTRIVSSYVSGVTLTSADTTLIVTATGTVGGTGVVGGSAGAYTIDNAGTIFGGRYSTGIGISLEDGGIVTNGSATDTTALVHAYTGKFAYSDAIALRGAAGTVVNFGTIFVTAFTAIYLDAGSVRNSGLIEGGIEIDGPRAAIMNLGTIVAQQSGLIETYGYVVDLKGGGSVVNGSNTDTTALIVTDAYAAVTLGEAGTVLNFGTVEGIDLAKGGLVHNGSKTDTTALVAPAGEGGAPNYGIYAATSIARIQNYGTIVGIYLAASGTVTNGTRSDRAALVLGTYGLRFHDGIQVEHGGAAIVNFGTISGFIGIDVASTSTATKPVTVTNFGTIAGTDGTAFLFGPADDVLVVEAGAVFQGLVSGGGGTNTLELAAGDSGTLAGIGTAFVDFQRVRVEADGDWTLGGINALLATSLLSDAGTLAIAGTLAVMGKLSVGGSAGDTALLAVDAGGIFDLTANTGIAESGKGAATLDNAGLLEKTGTKGATVAVAVANTGTIEVTSGALVLTRAVSGAGGTLFIARNSQLALDGSVSAGQTVRFGTEPAGLFLGDASGFKAAVEDFAAGDGLDLLHFGAGTTVTFTPDAAGGTLHVADASLKASITLFGHYVAGGFAYKQDGHGGTLVTYGPPATPSAQLAASV